MDFLNSWLPWLGLGGVGIFYVIALIVGIPVLGLASNVVQLASPLIKGTVDFIKWYLQNLWDGSKVVLGNLSTFVVIATIASGTAYWSTHSTKKVEVNKCEQRINQVHKKYSTKMKNKKPDTVNSDKGFFDGLFQ